ncbi:MAG: hypothetical protein K2N51_05860 [Lachnospiraceae bacterium]|nr:hypothetical protein [Lachnospiraceae bacterium]
MDKKSETIIKPFIEIHNTMKKYLDLNHRFRLKKEENEWKICAFNVWDPYDYKWHRGGI